MIITKSFVWVHLPKTAGTSTAELFRNLNLSECHVDEDSTDKKHQSITDRIKETRDNTLGEKHRIITIRRLHSWLLSDYFHKTKKMKLHLDFEPVKSGLFFALRISGGTWVTADYWLNYHEYKKFDHIVRLEHWNDAHWNNNWCYC